MSNRQVFRLDFGIDLLPAMLHALMLARCTAMMSSGRGESSVHAAFDEQYRLLVGQIGGSGTPEEGRCFVPDEYAWWRACTAMRTAHRYHFHHFVWTPDSWSRTEPYENGSVWPVVNGRSVDLGMGHRRDDALWPRFREALELLAPVNAVREPDVSENNVPEDRRSGRGWL